MMHGQRRHETRDRDHGWSRERQGEWEGGRTYLSLGARPREEAAQTADVHIWSKPLLELRKTATGDAHRIVPVECLGGLASQSR